MDDAQTIEFPVLLQPGDIVACWGTDPMSLWISFWTSLIALFKGPLKLKWAPSHVAMIGRYQQLPAWFESTSKCEHACLYEGKPDNGVQVHAIETRIHDYLKQGGRIAVYRLSPLAEQVVDTEQIDLLLNCCLERDIKYSFAGAGGSGTHIFALGRFVPNVDYVDVYCGEYLSAVCQNLGLLNRRDARHHNPGRLMRELVQTGVYVLHREVNP